MAVYDNIFQLVGNTPLLNAANFAKLNGLSVKILCKMECFNPAGSVKDRVALAMLEDGERRKAIKRGTTVIEPTSGNTGIAIAAFCAVKGYRFIVTMPDNMSEERITILKAYGAEVILTPAAEGMTGAIKRAEELNSGIDGSIILRQFENESNPAAHYLTTGRELLEDTRGDIDFLVSGVGTGGTVSGTGKRLKEFNPQIKVIAVEPASSPVLSKGTAGRHGIQGIGAGFVPKTLDLSVIDEIITVTDEEAFAASRAFSKSEGILVGISSGAALAAAVKVAQRQKGKTIAVILPDGGDKYLSTNLYKN